ncbi:MAG: SsrA-binding protein [Candidatus Woesebacteria bacterium GW2011_GWB1_43_14]|uniref:SsrA-binding protein n=1 Tax=Candidatus Woesebacteria bacterium GW2011_GWB1_43_14 TaxID=1618578 RepID=A0A0G1DMT9_9BACT|nr:MAG: SsrA-binding protein [Candidatus Woesebacteria bacterium GW2011_GWC1_42_9]KKS98974.1 MAG: SsrA-binding protein [Candidatus Woesebacteria bacterium GW2011_GWB1_43_14]
MTGAEVKAVRAKRANLTGSYAKFVEGELYLVNVKINAQGVRESQTTRSRKLLLHKNELVSLASKVKQKRLTIVPIALYTKGRLVKAELALAQSKKRFEKKDAKKQKDIEREVARELKLA